MIPILRAFALLAALFAPGASLAETRVRAGEHANFTRLVFYLPSEVAGWQATRRSDGYLIDIDPAPTALDTSEVFGFIPRTRIREVGLRDGRVWIGSDCDCHLSAFQPRPDVVAVDIRDGPDPAGDPEPERPKPQAGAESAFLPLRFDADATNAWKVPALIGFVPPAPSTPVIDPDAIVTAVARAASGGLLNPSDHGLRLEGNGIETRTALESAAIERDRLAQAAICQALSRLDDLPSIAPAEAWDQIEADRDGASDARLRGMAYLSLGFGAEAAVAFTEGDMSADTSTLLARVARVVDDPGRPTSGVLQSARSCGGVPGLIALLASGDENAIPEDAGRTAVGTLSRLPAPLRAHVGPYVEARLASAGFPDLARSARFAHERARDGGDAAGGSARSDTPRPAEGPGLPQTAPLPDTPFFDPRVSGDVLDTIAAARFAREDRILIEAWIQEAPSMAEADAATRHYVAALNRAGRPLDALAHLDARIGRRGPIRPEIEVAVSDTLGAASRQLGPGALIVLNARLAERPWYDRLPRDVRDDFVTRVDTLRAEILGSGDPVAPFQDENGAKPPADASAVSTDPGRDSPTASSRRLAAEAALTAAADSVARSAQLRADAAERALSLVDGAR